MAKKEKNKSPIPLSSTREKSKLFPSVTAKNEGQKTALRSIANPDNHIIMINGIAGTGKTFLATVWGLEQLLKEKYDKIILTRPVVEAGESLGFLPGDFNTKIAPFMIPIFDVFREQLSENDIKELIEDQKIITLPLAYMRGTAQPIESPILTPSGFMPLGKLKVGDTISSVDGKSQTITGVFPQGKKRIVQVTFTDGSITKCCEDHLWFTRTLSEKRHNKSGSVKVTKDIINTLKTSFGQKNHEIPIILPMEIPYKEVPIDPYFLGAMLGDGSIHQSASLSICSADEEILDKISSSLPEGYKLHNKLLGSRSHTKFIPDSYKWNSIDVRLSVLRGLLDTDGYVTLHNSGNSRIGFSSTSKQLTEDVIFLVQSLGGICHCRVKEPSSRISYINKRKVQSKLRSYILDIVIPMFNPFFLKRKAELAENRCKVFRAFDKIEYIEDDECICISVSSPEQLYITNDFIVTHNTFKNAFVLLDEAQNTTPKQMHLFTTRIGENSKMVIAGDTKQSDIKGINGFTDAISRLDGVSGLDIVELDPSQVVRHPIIGEIDKRYETLKGLTSKIRKDE